MKVISFKMQASIRTKTIGVLAASLAVSLLCYLYVGTTLIRNDRQSYVFDLNLARLQGAADFVESQLQQTARTAILIAELEESNSNPKTLEALYRRLASEQSVEALLLLRPQSPEKFDIW